MESHPSIEMQDYWNEVRTLRGDKKEFMSEEDKSNDELGEWGTLIKCSRNVVYEAVNLVNTDG